MDLGFQPFGLKAFGWNPAFEAARPTCKSFNRPYVVVLWAEGGRNGGGVGRGGRERRTIASPNDNSEGRFPFHGERAKAQAQGTSSAEMLQQQ